MRTMFTVGNTKRVRGAGALLGPTHLTLAGSSPFRGTRQHGPNARLVLFLSQGKAQGTAPKAPAPSLGLLGPPRVSEPTYSHRAEESSVQARLCQTTAATPHAWEF